MDDYLNIADVRVCTAAEGPGKRFAIWSQGCKLHCPGCCNPEMQPLEPRHIVSVNDLFALILKAREEHDIEGISLIGGEPFLQSGGMASLSKKCHEEGLSVLVFTGFKLDHLRNSNSDSVAEFLRHIDILVDGPFVKEMPDSRRGWVGSSNQDVFFLTDRYESGIEFEAAQSVEVIVSESSMLVNGWPCL